MVDLADYNNGDGEALERAIALGGRFPRGKAQAFFMVSNAASARARPLARSTIGVG